MKTQDRILLTLGIVFGTLAMIGGIVALLFWLLGRLDYNGLRWYAVIVTLALPVAIVTTYRLATHAAREHLSGFERGVTGAEHTITAIGRGLSATASMARVSSRSAARTLPASANDDLLPKVGTMRLIESQQDTNELIDL